MSSETKVLGALIGGQEPHDAMSRLHVDDFTGQQTRTVFRAVEAVYRREGSVSGPLVFDELERRGEVEDAKLASLPYGSTAELRWHVDRLLEASRRRRVAQAAQRLQEAAGDPAADVDKAVDEAFEQAVAQRSDVGLVSVEDMWDDIIAQMREGDRGGEPTGWGKVDRRYTVAPGMVTVVTGIPGSGKSTWLDCLTVNLALRGWRFVMFSPEFSPPAKHARKLIHTYCGREPSGLLDEPKLDEALAWVDDHYVWMDDFRDNTLDGILARARLAVHRKGCRGLVVDPWNKVRHDYRFQRQDLYIQHALSRFTRFARKEQVHVWIVAHPTKMRKEEKSDTRYEVPTAYDISGGAEWHNQADAIVSVWRDAHGEKRQPDIVDMYVQKVRDEGEWGSRGRCRLRFDVLGRRYREETSV